MVILIRRQPLVLKQLFMVNFKKGGFTLIEALVAITILLLGVLGPLSTATRGITDGIIAKDKIVALGLAQEGIELVRAKISDQWLENNGGDLSECDATTVAVTCKVEILNNQYTPCTGTGCDLRTNEVGFYVPNGSNGQTFTRTIKIERSNAVSNLIDNNTEAKVTVRIDWISKGQNHHLFLTTYIYNNSGPNTTL